MTATNGMTLSNKRGPPSKKPLLLFSCCPIEGHMNPLFTIAKYLASRDYCVAMLSLSVFQGLFKDSGVEMIPFNFDFELNGPKHIPPDVVHLHKAHLHRNLGEWTRVFTDGIPARMNRLVRTLEMLRKREPDRQIMLVDDCCFTSAIPLAHGAPLPDGFDQRPKMIGVSTTGLPVESCDTAPHFLSLPPDSSDSGRLRNKTLYDLMKQGPMKPMYQAMRAALEECGCTSTPTGCPISAQYKCYDVTLQLCSPSMEYHRSDLPSNIHHVGTLPATKISPAFQKPDWWPDVSENKDKKKIVFVSQGTVNSDQSELIQPTLEALSDRKDILIIVTLGRAGVDLDPSITLPSNARVAAYIPYGLILPWTEVFIANGGYGALTSAATHGTPVVFSGQSQEKGENAMRAAVIGLGRNLQTQSPKASQVREAVDDVLQNPSYKQRAMELKEENEKLNSLQAIEVLVESMIE